jgi:hypothetical protein
LLVYDVYCLLEKRNGLADLPFRLSQATGLLFNLESRLIVKLCRISKLDRFSDSFGQNAIIIIIIIIKNNNLKKKKKKKKHFLKVLESI